MHLSGRFKTDVLGKSQGRDPIDIFSGYFEGVYCYYYHYYSSICIGGYQDQF